MKVKIVINVTGEEKVIDNIEKLLLFDDSDKIIFVANQIAKSEEFSHIVAYRIGEEGFEDVVKMCSVEIPKIIKLENF